MGRRARDTWGSTVMAKLLSAGLFPDLQKIILLDNDVFVLQDIAGLWREFDKFTAQQLIGVAYEGQPTYSKLRAHEQQDTLPGHRKFDLSFPGFNGGVVLLHLDRMRSHNFSASLLNPRLIKYSRPDLGEQSLISALALDPVEMRNFYVLPFAWNYQLCDHWYSKHLKEGETLQSLRAYMQSFQALHSYPSLPGGSLPSLLHAN